MKLIMLGTGNARAWRCYNTCFVMKENNQCFLVDGGGGNLILHYLDSADFSIENIKDIFVTHKHTDHILGVFIIVHVICQKIIHNEYDGNLNIYVNDDVIKAMTNIHKELYDERESALFGHRVHLITVKDGETHSILGRPITFFDTKSKANKQFGFSMELCKNEKLTYCGDEQYKDHEKQYVTDSKWLLHDAYCLDSELDKYKSAVKDHSTVKEACVIAEKHKVKNLILLHTEDDNIENRKKLYTEEGSFYYHGNLFVPDDIEELIL